MPQFLLFYALGNKQADVRLMMFIDYRRLWLPVIPKLSRLRCRSYKTLLTVILKTIINIISSNKLIILLVKDATKVPICLFIYKLCFVPVYDIQSAFINT